MQVGLNDWDTIYQKAKYRKYIPGVLNPKYEDSREINDYGIFSYTEKKWLLEPTQEGIGFPFPKSTPEAIE